MCTKISMVTFGDTATWHLPCPLAMAQLLLSGFQESGDEEEEDGDEEEDSDEEEDDDDEMNGEVIGGNFNEEVRRWF